jgi:hypothetical protein
MIKEGDTPHPEMLRGTLKGLPLFRLAYGEGIKVFHCRPPA